MGFFNEAGNLKYKVSEGDTLFGIANKFKKDSPTVGGVQAAKVTKDTSVLTIVDSFAKFNGLNLNEIKTGETIDIPDQNDLEEYNRLGETNIFLNPSSSSRQANLEDFIETNAQNNLILKVPKGSTYWQIAGFLLKEYDGRIPENLTKQISLAARLQQFNGNKVLEADSEINLSKFFQFLKPTSTSRSPANQGVENLEDLIATRYGSTTLKKGSKGPEVNQLQKDLRSLSWLRLNESDLTSYFGDLTEEAVRKFQEAQRLTPDGKVGNLTKKALINALIEQFDLE